MAKLYGTPGPRAIWPTIARSRQLANCSMGARLLFDRLISQADDQGRLEGDPILVRAACMPLDREASLPAVRRWLNELEAAGKSASEPGLIIRYSADGMSLIQLAKWWTYQSGQKRIYASRWPGPEGWPEDRIKNTEDPRTGRHGSSSGGQPSDDAEDGAGTGAEDGAGDAPEPGRQTSRNPSPRARDSVPKPKPDSDTTPQPPASGGRQTRRDRQAPMRSSTDYDALLERDEPGDVDALFEPAPVAS